MPSAALTSQLQEFAGSNVQAAQLEWGEMIASAARWPPGYDGLETLRAIVGPSLCQVPHWGLVVVGSIGVHYADGRAEVAHTGEAYYLEPGHAPFTEEGAEVVEFSPAGPAAEMVAKVAAYLAGQSSA